jgi:hypothetical protein
MEETILELYGKLKKISENFIVYEKRNDFAPVQQCLNQMQEFAVWFMEENRLDEETAVWESLKVQLLEILQDIVQAIEGGDYVLLHDAVTYGLMEYLEIFLIVSEEEEDR